MKKKYIAPACEIVRIEGTVGLMAPSRWNTGDGMRIPISENDLDDEPTGAKVYTSHYDAWHPVGWED
jgi:hypothetical protein